MNLRSHLRVRIASSRGSAVAATPGALPDIPTPYLPSTQVAVDEMLRLAGTGPDDLVVDLGSGDGRMVIAAARDYGARGLGIEIDPKLVAESEDNARQAGVADRVAFRQGDVLAADYREATVVTLYLLPNLVEKLKPRLLAELKPGTRIVAHDYGFSDWKPDRERRHFQDLSPVRRAGGGGGQVAAARRSCPRASANTISTSSSATRRSAAARASPAATCRRSRRGSRATASPSCWWTTARAITSKGACRAALEMEGMVRSGTGRNLGRRAAGARRESCVERTRAEI